MDLFPKVPHTVTFSQIQMNQVARGDCLHVVFEGDDDKTLAKRMFRDCESPVHWIVGHGRVNCLRIHGLCKQRKVPRVLVVVDSDYGRKLNTLEDPHLVAYTDLNDMECTVLAVDPVVERHQEEFVDRNRVRECLSRCGYDSLFSVVVERAARLGAYRFVNQRDKRSLRFRNPKPPGDLPYAEFIDIAPEFSWRDEVFREWFAARNCDKSEDVAALFDAVDGLSMNTDDHLEWCQGHDLLALYAVIHSRLNVESGGHPREGKDLEVFVRERLSPVRLKSTEVFRRVEAFLGWELPSDQVPLSR